MRRGPGLVTILAGVALLFPAAAPGQAEPAARSARVDSLLAPWGSPEGPGCAVSVVHGGRQVHLGLHGSALVEHGEPIDSSTLFDLASLSKHFTAAAVALLVEDGVVSWDDSVRRWIPKLSEIHEPVRVRHLVHHTSGVREYFSLWAFAGRDIESAVEDEEVLAMLSRQARLNFPPGERESYSNSNYFLLAEIVERASGTSLDRFLRERLFRPLGMESTRFLDDHEDVVARLAGSYFQREDSTLARRVLKHDVVGPSGLHTTIDDMTRWLTALLSDGPSVRGLLGTLVERGTLNDGSRIPYALGLRVLPLRGIETVSHGGTMGGFRTFMVLVPEQLWGTVVHCNQLETSPFQLTQAITEIWFEDRMSPAEAGDDRIGPGGESGPASDGPAPLDVVGRYWSEELAAFLEILREGDGLAVRRGDLPAEPLSVLGPDELEMGGIRFHIERGSDGRVERIVLESGRAAGVVLRPAGGAEATATGERPAGPRLIVPRGSAPRLDGRFGESEWAGGAQVELDADGHGRFLHDGELLHVAIQGPGSGWSHVYLASGDTVRVLHASAALGSVRYVRSADGAWHTDEAFVYELRDTSLSPAAEEGRASYLAEHGWLASLFGMGEPGAYEFAIDLDRLGPETRIAILHAGDPNQPTAWPALPDDTRHPVLVRGDAPTPLSFDPDTWATLELAD